MGVPSRAVTRQVAAAAESVAKGLVDDLGSLVGSPSLAPFVRTHADELAADLCFYSDGSRLADPRPTLVLGTRGSICFELVAGGPSRPLHSGHFGGVAPNPAHDLCVLVAAMVSR